MRNVRTAVLAATVLVVSACGSSGDDVAPTDPHGDTSAVAGMCTQDQPDCDDIGIVDAPSPPGDDSGVVDGSDDVVMVDGMTAGDGLSVDEAIDTDVTGVVAVSGYLLDDGSGLRLCSVLAESFPPQCGGSSLTVEGFDFDRMIEVPEYELAQVERSGGVTWTDVPVTLLGEVVEGTLVIGGLDAG